MRPAVRFASIGAGVAAIVAVAASLYLRKSHEAVQRVLQPVELSAPDLFPAQTFLYAEMAGWEKSYARADAWWKRFETTAAWLALQRGWKENKLNLPPQAVEMLEGVDRELDRAKEKFGYRPTTREFFESYGKHIAVGLLPAPKGERPRFLLATRLPADAPRALQGYLSKAGGVKPVDPPLHQGFPVYQERVEKAELTVYYGVGRGYLFVSDFLPDIKAALERLALATDGGKKPEGTLAQDPVMARVRPHAKFESGLVYLRRDTKLADWMPDLAAADEFIRNAFVLAPKDDAVAFSLDGEVRSSFGAATPQPWTKSLPAGLVTLQATAPPPPGEAKKVADAQAADFFAKPLWKEIDAFLSDPAKVKAFLAEAIPAPQRPDDELASRLPNDARFLGACLKDWSMSIAGVQGPQFALAVKAYGEEPRGQLAIGLDLDPVSIFIAAGALDFARSRWSEWMIRQDRPGVLSWSLDMKRALPELREAAPPELAEIVERFLAPLAPTILLAGNRIILVFGPDLAAEIAAGGPSFEDDPLYVEARGQVRPGFHYLSWDRPAERVKTSYGPVVEWIGTLLERSGQDEETLEFLHAGVKTIQRAIGWAKPSRAVLAASYLDPKTPFESVELIDPEAEKGVPRIVPPDAPVRSPDFLPADTWLFQMQRIELKPSYDELRKVFVEALPGGEERLKTIQVPELADALVGGLLRNVKGEVGFAIATPHPRPAAEPGVEALLARMPAVVAFAEFEMPDEAFRAIRTVLEALHHEAGHRSEFKLGVVGAHRAAALDLHVEDGVVISIAAIERGSFLFLTTSAEVLRRLGSSKEKGADSLAARLPAVPEKLSSLGLFHGDTLIQQVKLYLDLATQGAFRMTLGGYEQGPPPDRVEAHRAGWAKWTDLVLDLFRTKSWGVTTTARTGNVVRSKTVAVPER